MEGDIGAEQLYHAARTIRGIGHVLFSTHSQTLYGQVQVVTLCESREQGLTRFFFFQGCFLCPCSVSFPFLPPLPPPTLSPSFSAQHQTHTTQHPHTHSTRNTHLHTHTQTPHTPHTPHKVQTGLCCFFGSLSFDLNGRSMAERGDAGGGTGSARRRRERRLRSMLRHERMAVAMALAENLHHSAQRPEKARAREVEEQDQHEALRRQKAPPPGSCRIPPRRGVLGSTVASAMSSFWSSMSLCCSWRNSRWTLLRWLSSRRRKSRLWRWSTWSWSVLASPSPQPRSSG